MSNFNAQFIEYLTKQGYDKKFLRTVDILSRGLPFVGVLVYDKDSNDASVIQAFILMSDKVRRSHRIFPFYRTHNWGKNNESVYPSCSIATRNDDGSWSIYDAHDSSRERDKSYLNYDLAVERFYRRADVSSVQETGNTLKYISWGLALILAAYFFVSLSCPDLSLPIDINVVSLFGLVAVLLLLPLLIPFIKGLSIFGIDFFIKKD